MLLILRVVSAVNSMALVVMDSAVASGGAQLAGARKRCVQGENAFAPALQQDTEAVGLAEKPMDTTHTDGVPRRTFCSVALEAEPQPGLSWKNNTVKPRKDQVETSRQLKQVNLRPMDHEHITYSQNDYRKQHSCMAYTLRPKTDEEAEDSFHLLCVYTPDGHNVGQTLDAKRKAATDDGKTGARKRLREACLELMALGENQSLDIDGTIAMAC